MAQGGSVNVPTSPESHVSTARGREGNQAIRRNAMNFTMTVLLILGVLWVLLFIGVGLYMMVRGE